ncbi:MAG: hypothetical protein CVV27_01370, partial [Candidatus Melainabacteria bacterium HGW-Melainabacteria-1]
MWSWVPEHSDMPPAVTSKAMLKPDHSSSDTPAIKCILKLFFNISYTQSSVWPRAESLSRHLISQVLAVIYLILKLNAAKRPDVITPQKLKAFKCPAPLQIASLAALICLSALPAQADLASNLRHTPADIDSFVSLSTAYEDWRYFLTRKPFAELFAKLRKDIAPDLEAQLGMNFDRDLAPMLGSHLSIAIFEEEFSRKETLPVLLVFDLKNTSGFPKLLRRLRDVAAKDKSKQLTEAKYQGVPIYGFASSKRKEGVPHMALSGKTLLLGSKNLVMKAIAAGQGKQAAALSNARFKVAHDALRSQKLWFYADPESLPEFIRLGENANTPLDARKELQAARVSMQESLDLYDSLGFGLDLNPRGLVFKTVARFKQQGVDPQKQAFMQQFMQLWNDPKVPMRQILQGSPARPLFFASVNGLQMWEQSFR